MGAKIITTAWLTHGLAVPLGKIDHVSAAEDNCITLVGGAVVWGPPKDFIARAAAAAALAAAQHQRETASVTTGVLAFSVTENTTIVLHKSTELLSVTTDAPAWVRVYSTSAARTADSGRLITQDATAGTGLQAEIITTNGLLSIPMSPTSALCNLDFPATTTLYLAITNLGPATRAVTVQFTHLQLEN